MRTALILYYALSLTAGALVGAQQSGKIGPVVTVQSTPVARRVVRTLSVYGYPGDRYKGGSRMANGQRFDAKSLTCATPFKRINGRIVDEFPMGSTITLPKGTKVVVTTRMSGKYWGRRIDLTPAAYLAEGGPKAWGLIEDALCEVPR